MCGLAWHTLCPGRRLAVYTSPLAPAPRVEGWGRKGGGSWSVRACVRGCPPSPPHSYYPSSSPAAAPHPPPLLLLLLPLLADQAELHRWHQCQLQERELQEEVEKWGSQGAGWAHPWGAAPLGADWAHPWGVHLWVQAGLTHGGVHPWVRAGLTPPWVRVWVQLWGGALMGAGGWTGAGG